MNLNPMSFPDRTVLGVWAYVSNAKIATPTILLTSAEISEVR